jgi:hypothetical protein
LAGGSVRSKYGERTEETGRALNAMSRNLESILQSLGNKYVLELVIMILNGPICNKDVVRIGVR